MQDYLKIQQQTRAQQAQRLLRSNGIASVLRRDAAPGRDGCGFALFVRGDVTRALSLLRAAGIPADRAGDGR